MVAFLFAGAIVIVSRAGTRWAPLLGSSHPEGCLDAKQTKETSGEQNTQRPLNNNSERAFSNDQKVVTVEKTRGIYTPYPRDVFTILLIHLHLMSALSEPLTSLFSLSGQRAIYATQASPNRDRTRLCRASEGSWGPGSAPFLWPC